MTQFLANEAKGTNIIGATSMEDMVSKLKSPRRVMLLVKGERIDFRPPLALIVSRVPNNFQFMLPTVTVFPKTGFMLHSMHFQCTMCGDGVKRKAAKASLLQGQSEFK